MRLSQVLPVLVLTTAHSLAAADPEPFQVTLGVRSQPDEHFAESDLVEHIQEAPNGDLFVAGYGESRYSDTGSQTKPMIARIDRNGNVVWKRIFDELPNHDILVFAVRGDEVYLVTSIRVVDVTGRWRTTQTVYLHRIDGNGTLSSSLGVLPDVEIYGAAAVVTTGLQKFVLAGIDAAGQTHRSSARRNIGLIELTLDGEFRRRPIAQRVTGVEFFRHLAGDTFVYLEKQGRYPKASGLMLVDGGGTTSQLFEWAGREGYLTSMVTTPERIFLVETIHTPFDSFRIFAYTVSGAKLWEREVVLLPEEHIAAVAGLRSGGLIYSSTYEGNPVVTRLDANGDLLWEKRFHSVNAGSTVRSIRELGDGWLGFAGATSAGRFIENLWRSDAVLTLTDASGAGLERFAGCLVDATELNALRRQLRDQVGIEARRAPVTPVGSLPPLDRPVPTDLDCGSSSEKRLLRFLQEAVRTAESLELSKPTERSKITIMLEPDQNPGFVNYAMTGLRQYDGVPVVAAKYGSAAAAMEFIAGDILPFLERSQRVYDQLQAIGGMSLRYDKARDGFPRILPLEDIVDAAENFIERFGKLSEVDQKAFVDRYRRQSLVISSDPNRVQVGTSVIVGVNRLSEVFDHALGRASRLEFIVAAEARTLKHELGLDVRNMSDLDPGEYLAVLREIHAAAEGLTVADIERIREIGVLLNIVDTGAVQSDMRIDDQARTVWLAPAAAPVILKELLANASQLLALPVRE